MGTKQKGTLIVVSGPSGAGKSTLIERFLSEDENSTFSVSYTTRKKRASEIDGKDYCFVTAETFDEMASRGDFLEWEKVHAYKYGTPKKEILEILSTGKDIILDIDVKGAINIRNQCKKACLIFIEPPSVQALIKRLEFRGEKEIDLRMKRVQEEIALKDAFGYTIRNEELLTAYKEFRETINAIRRKNNGENNC